MLMNYLVNYAYVQERGKQKRGYATKKLALAFNRKLQVKNGP